MSEQRVISYKIDVDDTPVKSLKQQLREATQEAQRLATADVIDQEALQEAVQKTAQLKDAMADVNEQVAVFASGSKYEQASNALGQVRDALFSLDFDKAQERAVAFGTAAKSINFGDAIKSVKALGSTFISLGKALLTNPLFLLAAVIVGIVVVVYKLLDALGVIKLAMEAVGKVVSYITDLFYSMTDALGITSKAAEDEAKATIEANNAKAASSQEYYSGFENGINNQLKLLKAADDGSKKSADAIIQKERELLFIKRHSAKVQAQLAESTLNALIASGTASKEEIESQRQKVVQLNQAFQNADTDAKAFELKVKNDEKKNKQKEKDDDAKEEKEAANKRKAANEKARQEREKAAQDKLKMERMIKDAELALMADGVEKELAIIREKNKRLLEDNNLNGKNLSEDQQKLKKIFQEQLAADEKKITDAKNLKEQEDLKKQKETLFQLEMAYRQKSISENDFTAKEQLTKDQYTKELEDLKAQLDSKAISQDEYNLRVKNAELQLSQDLDQIGKDRVAKEKENAELIIAAETNLQQAKKDAFKSGLDTLAGLVGENSKISNAIFAVQKALAIGEVIVNTQKEIAGYAANPTWSLLPDGGAIIKAKFIAAAKIRAATSIATIAGTALAKFKNGKGGGVSPSPSSSGGGGGGGGGSTPSASFGGGGSTPQIGSTQQTPNINLFQNQPTNQTNVVSVVDYTDIRNKAKRVKMIENAVSLGL